MSKWFSKSTKAESTTADKAPPASFNTPGTRTTVREVDAQSTLSHRDSTTDEAAKARSAYRWGLAADRPADNYLARRHDAPPPDHPVHQVPLEVQEKWRKKGINPVLRAEMDAAIAKNGKEGRFWTMVGGTSMGGGWIR